MRRYVLIDGALRVSLIGRGDRITYSTDHRLIGTVAANRGQLPEIRRGAIVSRVEDVSAGRGQSVQKALVSAVPLTFANGSIAVASIEQDYAPIAAAARESLLPVPDRRFRRHRLLRERGPRTRTRVAARVE